MNKEFPVSDKPTMVEGYHAVVEKTFITKEGYHGVCTLTEMGFRNGYVGLEEGHPLYGVGYSDIDNWIEVHGGITYAGPLDPLNYLPLWFFGFDCAHAYDIADKDQVKAYAKQFGKFKPSDYTSAYIAKGSGVRSLEYVEADVRKLSRELTPESLMKRKMEE